MKRLAALIAKLDDWSNPIVVKELRQAVQSKFVSGLLVLFLVGQLVTMAIVVQARHESQAFFEAGAGVFIILFGILIGTCLLFLPIYGAVRLVMERSGANVDLYFITSLRPRTIVWGKFLSGLTLAVLIYSAFMPFMTFTYLLRGIDLPTVFVVLFLGFVATAMTIQFGAFLACVPASRFLKVFLGLIGLGIIGLIAFYLLSLARMFVFYGWGTAFSQLVALLVISLTIVAAAIGYLLVWSVALLSPPSANRALPVRLYATITWAVTGAAAVIYDAAASSNIVITWFVLSVLVLCVGLLISVSEREVLGPRVARTIPRRWWLRPLAFLFYSGSAGGVVWSGLMIGLTLLVAKACSMHWYPSFYDDTLETMGGLALYVFCYALTALLIRRGLFPTSNWGRTWVIAVFLAGVAFFLPLLVFILSSDRYAADSSPWNLANPTSLFDDETRSFALIASGLWAASAALLNLPAFRKQIKNFRPLQASGDAHPSTADHE